VKETETFTQFNPNQRKNRRKRMKKKMIALFAGALMTLSASSAFAAFANLDLVRVVYDSTAGSTFEQADNLGKINTLLANSATTHDLVVGSTIANIGAGNNLHVAYFAINTTGSGLSAKDLLWIGATNSTLSNVGASGAVNTFRTVESLYNTTSGAGSIASVNRGDANSYFTRMIGSGTNPGADAGLFNATYAPFTEASLSNLANSAIQMNMFAFANVRVAGTGVLQDGFTITTDTTGHTVINASQVPIPAAAWLLGSGLMGLVGIRRKANKA
jgi:hypothetical protein